MSETVHVPLGDRAYDVVVGDGLLAEAGARIALLISGRKHVAVVSDETVAALHLETLRAGLAEAGISLSVLTLPPGEATNAGPSWSAWWNGCLRKKSSDVIWLSRSAVG